MQPGLRNARQAVTQRLAHEHLCYEIFQMQKVSQLRKLPLSSYDGLVVELCLVRVMKIPVGMLNFSFVFYDLCFEFLDDEYDYRYFDKNSCQYYETDEVAAHYLRHWKTTRCVIILFVELKMILEEALYC